MQLLSAEDFPAAQQIAKELQNAIHDHVECLRQQLTELAENHVPD